MLSIAPIDYTVGNVEWLDQNRKATVTLDAHSSIPPLGTVPNRIVQTWVYEKGDWYRDKIALETSPVAPAGGRGGAPGAPVF